MPISCESLLLPSLRDAANASYFAVVFTYGDGASTTVKVEANGCRGVFVGGSEQAVAWAVQSPELFDTFLGCSRTSPPAKKHALDSVGCAAVRSVRTAVATVLA
jgi:hypothetical protein